MGINLGRRIKYFRKRANLTQLELELKCNFAQGLISRIEKNRVNPTKETIKQIAKVLNLNQKELDYLIGETALPASDEEIAEAKKDVEDYFKKRGVFAYLLDERWRLISFSNSFIKVTNTTQEEILQITGKTIIQTLLDDELPIKRLFEGPKYNEILKDQFTHYFMETGFMRDDKYFKKTLDMILKVPILKNLFRKLDQQGCTAMPFRQSKMRKLKFKFNPHLETTLYYSREPLLKHPRFEIVEYIPTNKLLKFLSRL